MSEFLGTSSPPPHHAPERAGDLKHSFADLAKCRRILNYEPIVKFREGLEATTAWYASAMATAAS
jgi:nucleoside-diphosphate-sugar epimerase